MSDQNITLELINREQVRKGLNKLKAQGLVPAVIQNHGQESIVVSGKLLDVAKAYKEAGKHQPVEVSYEGKKLLTIIRDVDFDARKHQIRHVVFSIVKQDEKIKTEVSVELVGEAPAQKLGLIVSRHLDEVEIEALPKDLPDKLDADISNLNELNDKLTVGDIKVPNGVTLLTEPERVIVMVEEPVSQPEEEAVPEAAEPEEEVEADEAKQPAEETKAEDSTADSQ
ncbi:MAG TPA: 50S ribosomal protein L25 [Candidatus Saccharibacteria bacterium]|nr:50S ribosomal protein L25 [Candidatus Saccharibacteria bacterium]HPW47852.1 50S ribosomal protein L25 [Candidatus Saccharibacteria bacterium]